MIIIRIEMNVILQGDRTKNVGVVDSVFVVHKGIQTLGGDGHDTTTTKVLHSFSPLDFSLVAHNHVLLLTINTEIAK